eukprot:TRINITY_DN5717_c0_g1_i2.p1 TRINITY_DN5717_c0_g1~~TRINITY_DN5717_c0_g1_i2.p1  ORF type:complete len:256 (-),score=65.24 TRINITY_DN5717_c0_g1_i2:369-1136(-)
MLFSPKTERVLKWLLLVMTVCRFVLSEIVEEDAREESGEGPIDIKEESHSLPAAERSSPNITSVPSFRCSREDEGPLLLHRCPSGVPCSDLGVECLSWCHCPGDCVYGAPSNATCKAHEEVACEGPRTFNKLFTCQYCFQEPDLISCSEKLDCDAVSHEPYYLSNCSVSQNVLCLGRREFLKRRKCNWTGGYRWSTAVAFSVTLGGFGADRFYLGHWQEGIGKLVSFGGLGVWTLVDVVLVAIRYIGPADGSLYI